MSVPVTPLEIGRFEMRYSSHHSRTTAVCSAAVLHSITGLTAHYHHAGISLGISLQLGIDSRKKKKKKKSGDVSGRVLQLRPGSRSRSEVTLTG